MGFRTRLLHREMTWISSNTCIWHRWTAKQPFQADLSHFERCNKSYLNTLFSLKGLSKYTKYSDVCSSGFSSGSLAIVVLYNALFYSFLYILKRLLTVSSWTFCWIKYFPHFNTLLAAQGFAEHEETQTAGPNANPLHSDRSKAPWLN